MSSLVAQSALFPRTIDEVVQIVREHRRIQIVGAGSKHAMTTSDAGPCRCSIAGVNGIVEHQPSEFLITAFAGTSLTEMQSALAAHGQYLPFDPPLAKRGATIGGTVAAGLSGAGRMRFGGLRDFIVGIKMVDGLGNVVVGGGRVVKNAAGYDIPKLMVGSAGYYGAIVEVTLKVFPQPKMQKTVSVTTLSLASALRIQSTLSRSPIELAAIDLTPEGTLWLRMEGESDAIETTTSRIRSLMAIEEERISVECIDDGESVWRPLDDGTFAEGNDRLVRVPIMPSRLLAVDSTLEELTVRRRYSVAGNVAWIVWPESRPVQQLDESLWHLRLGGTVLTGIVPNFRIGLRPSLSMVNRVKAAVDPDHRFVGRA